MTRGEAEEIYIKAITSGEGAVAIKMTQGEANVFRVLVGRTMKEMESKNRTLWLKAREFGIEYKEPYAIIKRHEAGRFQLNKIGPAGEVIPMD